jgi:hypothetical protein
METQLSQEYLKNLFYTISFVINVMTVTVTVCRCYAIRVHHSENNSGLCARIKFKLFDMT